MKIGLKRAYEEPSASDGERFLVDRIWPRGVKKEELSLSAWIKEAAPSNELRQWFGHDPQRWESFREKYIRELQSNPEALQPLCQALNNGNITLVYSAKDETHNQAVVLREFLLDTMANALD